MSHVIIGTAGHIDHGKTALVHALTGVDTDRLKEEKERGLTIDLGFAHLEEKATIIDVPGHEKFIRNMVAGVSTIDLVLFVVAADDGVMPQTREHFDILNLLQVKSGFIVITKSDLVEHDWRLLVEEDLRRLVKDSFLSNAPLHFVSSVTGEGIPGLKSAILAHCEKVELEAKGGLFWMPVDRAFTMKGFGTVVTGSVLSGTLTTGQNVEILPQGRTAKVRAIQRQGHKVEMVARGDRAAINLQAIERDQLKRGNVLTAPNHARASGRFDARLSLLKSAPKALGPRTRVRVHVGTAEVMARVSIVGASSIEPGQSGYVQLHLEEPAAVRRLEPFVIRRYSPTVTIGGGVVLNAEAPRRKLSAAETLKDFQRLEKEDPFEAIEARLAAGRFEMTTFEELSTALATQEENIAEMITQLVQSGKVLEAKKGGKRAVVHVSVLTTLHETCRSALQRFHKQTPLKAGLSKAELNQQIRPPAEGRLLEIVLERMLADGTLKEVNGLISLAPHRVALSGEMQVLGKKVEALFYEEGFAPSAEPEISRKVAASARQVEDVLAVLTAAGNVVRVEQNMYFHAKRVEEAQQRLLAFLRENERISISQFKALLNDTSRKYAMPLINYFDAQGITRREGDVRVLNE